MGKPSGLSRSGRYWPWAGGKTTARINIKTAKACLFMMSHRCGAWLSRAARNNAAPIRPRFNRLLSQQVSLPGEQLGLAAVPIRGETDQRGAAGDQSWVDAQFIRAFVPA